MRVSAQISIAIVCLVLGIMLSTQFQASRYYNVTSVPERVEDLSSQIRMAAREKEALELKADSLMVQLNNSKNYDQALADLERDLETANLTAGFIPVEGPGVIITVSDNPNEPAPDDDPNNYLVHDQHLLLLTNELKAAGAEAISINKQRITAMSEIRCAGTLINVNGVKIGPPFTVQAIGDADVLYGVMMSKNGYMQYLNMYGLSSSIEKSEDMRIPALKKPKNLLQSIEEKTA